MSWTLILKHIQIKYESPFGRILNYLRIGLLATRRLNMTIVPEVYEEFRINYMLDIVAELNNGRR
jgi:hypothetical protein